jgi:hypothetical protein
MTLTLKVAGCPGATVMEDGCWVMSGAVAAKAAESERQNATRAKRTKSRGGLDKGVLVFIR